MRLTGSDPDIQTLVSRIRNGDIVLQPNFQRGEVWGETKKRRLIDSILRDWHIPPIHVIKVKETGKLEVLDGQQRLVALRDFASNNLTVDGETEPDDPEIAELHGKTYETLPEYLRRRFDQFTIRVFTITDYSPGEPGELFFRLNQPTNLTAAEQRNAFFGPARQQVKDLVTVFEGLGLGKDTIGFSNSRMAYDDVIAKLCLTMDNGTLREKVTAGSVTSRYRSQIPFKPETINHLERGIIRFAKAKKYFVGSIKFNKATLYSWLCFTCALDSYDIEVSNKTFAGFLSEFEQYRNSNTLPPGRAELMDIFNDRASSRVSDVSSVLLRDTIIWIFFYHFLRKRNMRLEATSPHIKDLILVARETSSLRSAPLIQDALDIFVQTSVWGSWK